MLEILTKVHEGRYRAHPPTRVLEGDTVDQHLGAGVVAQRH